MLKDYKLLAAVSLVGLVVVALAIARATRPEYATHQRTYYELCGMKGEAVGIRQVNFRVGDDLLIDRCQSCHVGAFNPDAAAFAEPLATHPAIVPGRESSLHDVSKIGCVVCHDGNGRAVRKEDAHGQFHMWPAPLLSGVAAQANCIRCHDTNVADLKGADVLARGRALYFEKVCWSCHTIEGVSSGKAGPDLTDAGGKFGMDYLRESIVHPRANIETSRMPQFNWVDDRETIEALVVYLKSQQRDRLMNYARSPVGSLRPEIEFASIDTPSVAAGRAIFMSEQGVGKPRRGGCINCHAVREQDGVLLGGHIGTELTYAGRARTAEYLREQIVNARKHSPDSVMPVFGMFRDAELESLVLYLQSLTYTDSGAQTGKALYLTYCASCHGEDLSGKGANYSLLDPYPRNLSRRQFVNAYKSRFANSVSEGIAGTAMPPWKTILSPEQVQQVIAFIIEESARKDAKSGDSGEYVRLRVDLPTVGAPDRVTEKPLVAGRQAEGHISFLQHCAGCHGKLANGKGPVAYLLGNVYPRNFLNDKFLKQAQVTDDRLYESIVLGVPGTPMPSHSHLSDQTVLDLIAYIRTLTE